jgi:actin-like ATPase involved in cell morphogenesis
MRLHRITALMARLHPAASRVERLRRETGIPVHVADDALMCVAIGSGRSLEEINSYRSALSSA